MTPTRRTRETKPAWQCAPRRGRVGLVLVTDAAGLRSRLARSYAPEQAAALTDAAVADTLGALPAVPDGVVAADSPTDALAYPALLVRAEFPQLNPAMVGAAAALLGEFDAVLGLTSGDGWWGFGLREPAQLALPRDASALTVAVLRLGLRVAMLPTLHELRTEADVEAVAEQCPVGSGFASAVAQFTPSGRPGR